jgi:hypothetical protein
LTLYTTYYRQTDPKTGKQTWIPIRGLYTSGDVVLLNKSIWTKAEVPPESELAVLYTNRAGGKKE